MLSVSTLTIRQCSFLIRCLAFLLPIPGCVDQYCFVPEDCDAPKICSAAGVCVYRCITDAECAAGFVCQDHDCVPDAIDPITCPDDMTPVADTFCVDVYEASRPDATAGDPGTDESIARSVAGVLPWRASGNAAALAACQAAGKRLCSPDEWALACAGPDHTTYAYGDAYQPTTCNGIDTYGRTGFHLMPTGSFPGCTNEWGVFDMNGNIWEHVAGGTDMDVRGGAFNCSDSRTFHRCDYVPGSWTPSALGFRCCKDGEPGETP
jgi:Cys-rich repeat protein